MLLEDICLKLYLWPFLSHLAYLKGLCSKTPLTSTPFPFITLPPGVTLGTTRTTTTTSTTTTLTPPPTFVPLPTTITTTTIPPTFQPTVPVTSTTVSTVPTFQPTLPPTTTTTTRGTIPTFQPTVPTAPPTTITTTPVTTTTLPPVPSTICPIFPVICLPGGQTPNPPCPCIDPRQYIFAQRPSANLRSANKCQGLDNQTGICTNIAGCSYLIEEFYYQLGKQSSPLSFDQFLSRSMCGFDGINFLICCPVRGQPAVEPSNGREASVSLFYFSQLGATELPLSTPLGTSTSLPSSTATQSSPVSPVTSKYFLPLSEEDECGLSNATQTRVVGGFDTKPACQLNPIAPEGIYKTAVMTSFGLHEFLQMPFGGKMDLKRSNDFKGVLSELNFTFANIDDMELSMISFNGISPSASRVKVIREFPTSDTHKKLQPFLVMACRVEEANETFFYVEKGTGVRKGAYPWIAALGYRAENPAQPKFLCGGTLITSRHILTSAHCVTDDLYVVRLGAHDLSAKSSEVVDASIEAAIVHENFDRRTVKNDIALLKLKNDVPLGSVRPICLPVSPPLRSMDFVGMNPFVAGWGAVLFQGPATDILQDAQLPVISLQECEKDYQARFPTLMLDKSILCAGGGTVDACQGDSGGPLMFPYVSGEKRSFHYFQIGIVSFGYECARSGFPGIYTRVTEYIPWIEENINK